MVVYLVVRIQMVMDLLIQLTYFLLIQLSG